MPFNFDKEALGRITYLTGNEEMVLNLLSVRAMPPFHDYIVEFLSDVSKELMGSREAKRYSDVVAFGFWLRKSAVLKQKQRFETKGWHLGKGVVFHIAPSNVPVNFAYSLVCGLLTGNANIVRVPGRDFPQVKIIVDAMNHVLENYKEMKPYVLCVRYGHDREINDLFSAVSDMRVIWGGDQTIEELRKSPLPPRSGEVTFADRYSLAVIDSDFYMAIENKERIAEDFYNDTFFSDQNACTSPRAVIWTGGRISEAKNIFWEKVHKLVKQKYTFQAIQGVNKLTSSYLIAAKGIGVRIEKRSDNLIFRVKVPEITDCLMDYKDNSGYFYEYDCKDILELTEICNNKRCQTIAYIGDAGMALPLLQSGVKGIDRIVPMGKTMDFDLIWDGYNLTSLLARTIAVV